MKRQRALALILGAAVLGAVTALAPLGCRNVLGVQTLGDDSLTCDVYCDTVMSACSGAKAQYVSREACMGLCPTFPVGALKDVTKNTLGCRLTLASNIANTGEGDCAGAGPGGAGDCGSDYESFCTSAVQVCPTDFTSVMDCETQVAPTIVPECGTYAVSSGETTPDVNSIQCRLYHVTAASLDPTTHCPHVHGDGLCTVTGPQCDGGAGPADGGDGG